MAYLIEHKPEEFLIYTGEDGDAFHAMNLGADGVISVASHTNGDEMHRDVYCHCRKRYEESCSYSA